MPEHTKKAWEIARELFENAEPVVRTAEDQTWEDNIDVSEAYDQSLSLDWGSNVPGSGAPEKIMVADCNAGVIMPVIGISRGIEAIPRKFMHPVFEKLTTYMRGGYAEISTDRLTEMTVSAVLRAYARPAGGE